MTTVAVLGTGIMGSGMVHSMLRAGLTVRVWNRTIEKAKPLEEDGASVCTDPSAAAAGADVVITMVFDEAALEDVMADALSALSKDAVWLQTATVGVGAVERFAALADQHGTGFVDAPVLGTREPAEQGALVILAAGSARLRPVVAPVLDAIGSRAVWVSERPGDGHRLKLAANSWILSVAGATAQAVALARASGLDPQLFLDAIRGGPADCTYAQLKARSMISRDFAPSFTLGGALKDSGMIVDALNAAVLDPSLMAALNALFARAADAGHEHEDMAAVITALGA
jgi:3-hydroxyisobutyrate dehydrogenase